MQNLAEQKYEILNFAEQNTFVIITRRRWFVFRKVSIWKSGDSAGIPDFYLGCKDKYYENKTFNARTYKFK